ncbi:hypothetical protein MCOR25_001481 [Pyricularia grisea]|uniref:Endoglucanase EG-II n=1 Tax=Pyricularia grisea TaxID=148305 RepID=A0A6P8AUC4_PYRGI|nr:uncharacterized protein PgNI_09029 [Pyricularia grisea]KAI6380806.1 hypothetical protein MCOR25_001481 [Pyricularia grisea]TLD05823.1 hypothetical protein PgNI_09029 [Pyricularia grisea]
MIAQSLLLLGLSALCQAKVQFLGVAIAGGDFGCQIDGTCPLGSTQLPLGGSGGGGDGAGQMNHWVKDRGLNMFRLPISWQSLTNNQLGGQLDSNNFGRYDQLMQSCLKTGAYCMLDIHNFARWNGQIIGQGGPTDDQFVNLWTQLATKYAANEKVVFELMNEPHDLDMALWAQTCQKVVTAIRNAGATKQMILLPSSNFNSAATMVSSGDADLLVAIKNPDGTTDGLLLDVHKYLDVDNSGTHSQCTTDNTAAFQTVADYLRKVGRKALVSETGASMDSSCITAFCTQNALINANSDVFIGLVGWAAGSFSTSYILSLTPTKNGNTYTDNALMNQCMIDTWLNSTTVVTPTPQPSSPAQSASGSPNLGVSTTTRASSGLAQQPTAAPNGTRTTTRPASVSMSQILPTGVYDPNKQKPTDSPTTLMMAPGTPTVPGVSQSTVPTNATRPSSSGTDSFPGTSTPLPTAGAGATAPPVWGLTAALLAGAYYVL